MRIKIERKTLPRPRWRRRCIACRDLYKQNQGIGDDFVLDLFWHGEWRRMKWRAYRDMRRHFLRYHAGEVVGESLNELRRRAGLEGQR